MKRIDLHQRGIGIFRRARQRHHELHRAADVLGVKSQLERDLARLVGLQAHAGNDVLLDDRVRIFRRNLFDLHATRRRRHEHVASVAAVEHDAEIQLARDGQRLFDQQTLHLLALGPGLVRDQRHAEHLGGNLSGLLHRLGDLHAAALATPAGVNLRLDYNSGCAIVEEFAGRRIGFLYALDHVSREAQPLHTSTEWTCPGTREFSCWYDGRGNLRDPN